MENAHYIYDDDYEEPEPLTDEEIEALGNSPDYYSEPLQFITTTHTTKAQGQQHKREAARGTADGARFATAYFNFYELVRFHGEGMTFRRLPVECVKNWETRFLVLDFDNKEQLGHEPLNVTREELDQVMAACNIEHYGVTPSGDRKEFHWHLFIFLQEPVRTGVEYVKVRDQYEIKLRSALCSIRNARELPRLTDPKLYAQTCVFAPVAPDVHPILKMAWTVENNRWNYGPAREHLERSNKNPSIRTSETVADSLYRDWLVPLSSSGFCKWLHRHNIIEKERVQDLEFDVKIGGNILRYLRPGATKATMPIEEGTRNNTISTFLLKLYAKAQGFNVWLVDHGFDDFTFKADAIVNSFRHYIENAYETAGFDLDPYVTELRQLCHRNENRTPREYCESVSRFSTGKHQFRTRDYIRETASDILEQFDDGSGVARFDSVAYRDGYLKERAVSLATLRKVAKEKGKLVRSGSKCSGGSRTGAGRPASVSWESLGTKGELVDGVFHYYGVISGAEKKFLQRQVVNGEKVKVKKNTKKETNQK